MWLHFLLLAINLALEIDFWGGCKNWTWLGEAPVVAHKFRNTDSDLLLSGAHSSFGNFLSVPLASFSSLSNVNPLTWKRKRESSFYLSSSFSSTLPNSSSHNSCRWANRTFIESHLYLMRNIVKCLKDQVQGIKEACASSSDEFLSLSKPVSSI